MLKKKIEDALNAQINAEMWSAYLYLSMAAYCQDHAKILFNYVISRNGKVDLRPIEAVPTEWNSILNVFESSLRHEQTITESINKLFALCAEENDYATQSMLKWFIDEQVEEEENVQTIIDNIKMIKDNGYGIYMIDKELGQRAYTPATPLA